MTRDPFDLSSQPPPFETVPGTAETPETLDEPNKSRSFPIIGVGASAGGLEAFTQLLKALPCDTGMAFVLVQHLAPTHASALAEILSRATQMPVTEVQDEPTVEQNHVYVIPPGRSMIIAGDSLQLLPREGTGIHRPIDQFFRSLAETWRHRAIGVVLSGTATDGTLGLEAIKAEGGITFAQDASAQHDGMPRSAIASGCVDFVLPPEEIAREIVRIGHHACAIDEKRGTWRVPSDSEKNSDRDSLAARESPLATLLQMLHGATGVDFSHYKLNTLYRRITRRMILQKLDELSEYVEFLRNTPAEVEALYQDILISVTSFFRDQEAFDALQNVVFPRLMKGRTRHDPVRIWVIGCSTGQEAYSLAIAYMEAAEAVGSQTPLQVFATDLNVANIERARAGVYPKDIAGDVSPDRLRRYFSEVDTGYRINKTIRDTCVFSQHNVLTDPPFSRIDLISCRNMLIYMEPVLQQRIVPLLHYALKPTGCLWLGGSETIGSFRNLFEPEDSLHKIYTRRPGCSTDRHHLAPQHAAAPRAPFVPFSARPVDAAADLHKEADRILLNKFAPPGVVVSADLEILQYRGDTGPFLTPAPGKASFSLLKMLREGLLIGVRAAIVRAGTEGAPVRDESLRVKSHDGCHNVAIEVIPLRSGDARVTSGEKRSGGFLVLFEQKSGEGRVTSGEQDDPSSLATQHSSLATQLEQELAATRDYLQSLVEEQEAANEELQSANEEVQSANEELQSTNEELETSKEEIQSSNEELATVNDELNNRNAELNHVNNDLMNLIASIQSAVVMLGPDLRIRRFTPSAETLLNLIPGDVGRPLADIKLNLDGLPDLALLLRDVLDTADSSECEVRDKHGRWYSLRLRPYRTVDNRIDGVVVMLVDVDTIKRAHEYTESIVATVREPLLVLDRELRVQSASRSFYETFQAVPEDTLNRPLFELGNRQWDIPELRRLLVEVLPLENDVADFEMEYQFERIGRRSMRLNARRLIQAADHTPLILLAIEDITERQIAQQALRDSAQRFQASIDALPAAVYTTDPTGRITYANLAAIELAGRIPDSQNDRWCLTRRMFHPDGTEWPHDQCPMATALRTGRAVRGEEVIVERPDGTRRWVQPYPTPLLDAEGRITGGINMLVDITERKRTEAAIVAQHRRLTVLSEAAKALLFANDPDAMLRGLLARIGPPLGVDVFFNYMVEQGGDALRLVSSDGIPPEDARTIERLEFGQALCGTVALSRKPLVRTHLQQSDDPDAEFARAFGFRAYVCNPLLSDDLLLGTLSFASRSKDQFDPDELTFLQTISDYVAVAYARMHVQDAVRDSEERLRFIMDSMPQKVFTTTPGGDIDYFNPQWTEFTGMTFEELYDSGWTHFVHPDDLPEKTRLWKLAFETGAPFQSEHRFRGADGEYRWHFSRATPLHDEDGSILMWVGSNTDVHDIKQAEIALHESEVRYRRLFEASKDGVLILDSSNGKIIDVNPFMRELLGYSHDEFMGKELWEIGLFSDKAANEAMVQTLQETGYVRFEHLPLRSKGGRSVEVEVVANAYQEDHYSVIQCNIRDITERTLMETVLRRQAVQLSELHRRKDEFLAMLSHELRSPLAPIANAVQLLGLQKAGESRIQQQARGIIERQVGQLQHLVDDLLEVSRITTGKVQLRQERVDLCRIAEGAVETVRPLIEQRRHELTVLLPQEPVWMVADAARLEQVLVNLLTNASKYTEPGGHIWLTVEIVAGENSGEWRVAGGEKEKSGEWRVTRGEKKKVVGDILPIPDLTTHHSSLTTSAFSHDRATLPGTQGLAGSDEPGRALLHGDEKFPQGGTVRAHHPDSPSGSISASQHSGGTRTPSHEGIPEFSQRGERIADGTGNTLAAQSASGPAQSNHAGFASDDVGRNQSDAVGPSTRAGAKSDEWRVASGEELKEPDHATSEPPLATHHSPLTTHHSPLATPWAVIRVRDTGVGISPTLLPHVFDLFTQADRSLDRSQGGLGIGLALVQRLAVLHGGTVKAFSTMGDGSEFVVRLPVQSEEWRVTSGESQNSSSLTTHLSPHATPLRVLVVDDNADTVLGFSMLLKASGYDVRTANDGLAAVEAAIDFRPDVVLLDIGLPGLNGYEVAKRLRQHPDLRNIVLIALTGYGQDTDRQTSQQAGFDHHLVKPARFDQLRKILATVHEGLK